MNEDLAAKFMELFAGLDRAYGVYLPGKRKGEDGKVKGRATTEHAPVTVELWQKHLSGEQGLGIVPIRDDGTILWAAIDVDTYPLDHAALEQRLLELKLPLIVAKSKSGGAHLFLFAREPLPAKLVRARLNQWATLIGHPGVEIFPKQDQISRQGDVGNWLNMPYFNCANDLNRCAIWDGQPLTPELFITKAQTRLITREALDAFRAGENADQLFSDAPPCLQHLAKTGFPRGTRNRGLFNLGVLARFAADDGWRDLLDDFNRNYMNPPLSTAEVINTVKSLSRKNYFYTCSLDPIASVCSKEICKTRRFGIGNTDNTPAPVSIDSIIKIESVPPVYMVKVEGRTLQCDSETLLSQAAFKRLVFEYTNRVVPTLPQKTWESFLNEKMESAEIVLAPQDAGPEGQFFTHLENFCTSRVTANTFDEILLGKPYVNGEKTFFRSVDLLRYLDQQRFREFTERQIWGILRKHGAEHEQHKVKGKCITTWSIKSFLVQTEEFSIPKVEGQDL